MGCTQMNNFVMDMRRRRTFWWGPHDHLHLHGIGSRATTHYGLWFLPCCALDNKLDLLPLPLTGSLYTIA